MSTTDLAHDENGDDNDDDDDDNDDGDDDEDDDDNDDDDISSFNCAAYLFLSYCITNNSNASTLAVVRA